MRLDLYLVKKKLVESRNKAQSLIQNQRVKVFGKTITKANYQVPEEARRAVVVKSNIDYVSRGGNKLELANSKFNLNFKGKIVFDIGCHVGGFTDYALQNKARSVVAIDVGSEMLAPKLIKNKKVVWFNKTNIKDFSWPAKVDLADLIVVDVSFVSLTKVLPSIRRFCQEGVDLIVLVKPQFEAGHKKWLKKGIVKNNQFRRQIFKKVEDWLKNNQWLIKNKADSPIFGSKGNQERFYHLKPAEGSIK